MYRGSVTLTYSYVYHSDYKSPLVASIKKQEMKHRGRMGRTYFLIGDRGGTVVKVLCYKSEGRCFDPTIGIFH